MRFGIFAVCCAAIVSGCAKGSDSITAAYVSPYQYENWTCWQLAEEASRVNARAMQAAGIQDEKATRDTVATTVGVVIFWPALFFIGGNDQQTAELARLRGEAEAVELSARHKQCGMGQQTPVATRQPLHVETETRRIKRASATNDDGPIGLPYGLNHSE